MNPCGTFQLHCWMCAHLDGLGLSHRVDHPCQAHKPQSMFWSPTLPVEGWWWWLLLYSAILRSRPDSLHLHVILQERLACCSMLLNIHQSGVLKVLAWLVPHETAAVSAQVLRTPYNHAQCHFMQSHKEAQTQSQLCHQGATLAENLWVSKEDLP